MTRRGPVVVRARRRATACLDLKRQPPLLGSLQTVHATGQISYLFIQCHHPSTHKDAFQRHQERAEPTHDSETADCRSRSNKKHQRGKGKQAGGQCQSSVARQCCDQDWKQKKGERGNAETLQKLTQVFDMLSHYTIMRLDAAEHARGQRPIGFLPAVLLRRTALTGAWVKSQVGDRTASAISA